jgi:hypothetical protein
MGGINCPHRNTQADPVSPRVMGEYVDRLAGYCQPLFAGTASFFDANAKIETAVLESSGLNPALEALRASEDLLTRAQVRLSSVASMWQVVSTEPVDFVAQDSLLRAAVYAVADARTMLSHVPRGCDNLQTEIWSRPAITTSMVKASSAVSSALAWQADFAVQTAAVSALAA